MIINRKDQIESFPTRVSGISRKSLECNKLAISTKLLTFAILRLLENLTQFSVWYIECTDIRCVSKSKQKLGFDESMVILGDADT